MSGVDKPVAAEDALACELLLAHAHTRACPRFHAEKAHDAFGVARDDAVLLCGRVHDGESNHSGQPLRFRGVRVGMRANALQAW